MKKILTIVLALIVAGTAFAATRNPYANGKYEQSGSDVTKCILYGMTVDGTLYPVLISDQGTLDTQ